MGCVTTVDVLSTLISPPDGMDADSAAASAYLQAMGNQCKLQFIATSGANFDEKWQKKGCVPIEQHVGVSLIKMIV